MIKQKLLVSLLLTTTLLSVQPPVYGTPPGALAPTPTPTPPSSNQWISSANEEVKLNDKVFTLHTDPLTGDKMLLIPKEQVDPGMMVPGDTSIDPGMMVELKPTASPLPPEALSPTPTPSTKPSNPNK